MDIRIVDGNLVKDAEVKTSKNGSQYISLLLANNTFVNQTRTAIYFNVVSYDTRLIERELSEKKKLLKGRPIVVTGRPSENITVKDGTGYLNRNIIAISIESHGFESKKEDGSNGTYHTSAPITSVAAAVPTVEQPAVTAPSVQAPAFKTVVEQSNRYSNPTVEAPVMPSAPTPQPQATGVLPATLPGLESSADDDLPF